MQSLASIELSSLALLLAGIGPAFSDIRLSGWVVGWILLSGALRLAEFWNVPDAQLLAAVRTIGSQVGQFLQRRHKVAA